MAKRISGGAKRFQQFFASLKGPKIYVDNSFDQVIIGLAISKAHIVTGNQPKLMKIVVSNKGCLVGWVSQGCQDEQILRNLPRKNSKWVATFEL